jgi:hypothetical protein
MTCHYEVEIKVFLTFWLVDERFASGSVPVQTIPDPDTRGLFLILQIRLCI